MRMRVEALVLLLDVLPRSAMDRLDSVVREWDARFSGESHPSVKELRLAASAALRAIAEAPAVQTTSEQVLRRAQELVGLSNIPVSRDETPAFDALDGERACVEGLRAWLFDLEADPRWSDLPAVVPGEPALPLDSIYVELFVVPTADASDEGWRVADRSAPSTGQRQSRDWPLVTALTVISRTLDRTVVIGDPGSGKSTLLLWILRAVHKRESQDFDAALLIKLSAFAAELEDNPACTLVEFFFSSLRQRPQECAAAAKWLRQSTVRRNRLLLLLDGWDEVPPKHRERVKNLIDWEQLYFSIILASRPSGLPRELIGHGSSNCYKIAGLGPRAKEELIANLLRSDGRSDMQSRVVERIQADANLHQLAGSPFLLTLLVRMILRTLDADGVPRTVSDLYGQIVAWITDVANAASRRGEKLTKDHLNALCELSYTLLFESEPRYIFSLVRLEKCMSEGTAEPIVHCRLVNRVDPVFEEYAFLHASFQEYFAALFMGGTTAHASREDLDHAFCSMSRLIVLQFMAGLGGIAGTRCRAEASRWMEQQDEFRQVLHRVARIAAYGRWDRDRSSQLVESLRSELWSDIANEDDMGLVEGAVNAYAEMDAVGLCRRARQAKGLSNWAIECVLNAVPDHILRQERMDELLSGMWRDYWGLEIKGGATAAELSAIMSLLAASHLEAGDRKEAIIHARATRDSRALPLLLRIAESPDELEDLREQAIDSIGAIGGRVAVEGLVRIVVGDRAAPPAVVRMAVAVLRHSGHNSKALDPAGRDQLVRRLAVLPFEAEQLSAILGALEGIPLRDGSELVATVAKQASLPTQLRARAAAVLATVTDRALVEDAVVNIQQERESEIISTLLDVALSRSVAVPLDWLKGKIVAAREKVKRREFLTTYAQMIPWAAPVERRDAEDFLNSLIAKALADHTPQGEELADTVDRALTMMQPGNITIMESTTDAALHVLEEFSAKPEKVRPAHALLAARVCEHSGRTAVVRTLRAALEVGVELGGSKRQTAKLADAGRMATAFAGILAKLAPRELLKYSRDCMPVRVVLRGLSIRKGWLVFRDRILDADGVEIASSDGSGEMPASADTSELAAAVKSLALKEGRILYSYWLMVNPGGPCEPTDSLKAIYDKMVDFDSATEDDIELGQRLDDLFADSGYPKFGNWKKTLSRVTKKLVAQDQLSDELRRLGLGRRSSK